MMFTPPSTDTTTTPDEQQQRRRRCSPNSALPWAVLIILVCTTFLFSNTFRSSPHHHRPPRHRRQSPSLPTTSSQQLVPTVPSSPPALPTPFPQAFDGRVAQNFSTLSCASFFANMTSAAPFRTCRPFSLLLGTSAGFINAQTNLTLLNTLVWGTCNTPTAYDQCKSNMAFFASSLQTACRQELKDRNVVVLDTLVALQAFDTLRTAGCLVADPAAAAAANSASYCYLAAAQAQQPFDIYLYGLPLGIHLPKSSTAAPSCSSCSKAILGVYADALRSSGTGKAAVTALKATFGEALTRCRSGCGEAFDSVGAGVNLASTSSSSATSSALEFWSRRLLLLGPWLTLWLAL